MLREVGFYWVKTWDIEGEQTGVWQPAFLSDEGWLLCGNECLKPDEYLMEIKERIIFPDKYQPERDSI